MRIWVIISSVVILLFCIPGLLLTLFAPDWKEIIAYLLLNALAIHGLYYAKVALADPLQGYRQLALGQLLLGILCAVLLIRLNALLANPALWENATSSLLPLLQMWPGVQGQEQEVEEAVQMTLELVRERMTLMVFIVAAIVLLSQILFAWLLHRRARPATATT